MVIEGTVTSFSVGHQITLALTKNKPILFLVQKDEGAKKHRFQTSFIDGLKSPLLTVVRYDRSTLPDILNDFLNKNGGRPVVKFNIVLTKEIENYLDWASFTYKVNRSEFIRNLILNHMNITDERYKKYLGHR